MAFLLPGRRNRFGRVRTDRRAVGTAPFGPPSQAPQSLRRRLRWARDCGVRDAQSGALDAWSFPDQNLPFLAQVRAARNTELAQAQINASRAQRQHLARRQRRTAHAGEDARIRAEHAWQAAQADDQLRRSEGRMDALAQREASERAERRRTFINRHVQQRNAPEQSDPAQLHEHVTRLWEGRAPQVSRWFKIGLILALIAVEFPVEFLVLAYFHNMENPTERVLVVILALSVSTLTVLAPHLIGQTVRRNQVTGAPRRTSAALCVLMLLIWSPIPVVFGLLRAKQILIPPTDANGEPFKDDTGHPIASVADQLHVSPTTLLVAFIALLFISGAIGLLLGLAEEHPAQAIHRRASKERRRLGEVPDPDGSVAAAAQELDNEDAMQVATQWHQEQIRIWETAQRLMVTYLHALSQQMADPKTTQAINALVALIEAERHDAVPTTP